MEEPRLSTRLIAPSAGKDIHSTQSLSDSAVIAQPDMEGAQTPSQVAAFGGREDAGAASETNHAHHVHIEVPEGAGYASADAHLAVGMADALRLPCCGMGVESAYASPTASGVRDGLSQGESSAEVIPHTRVLDAVDLSCPDLKRLLAQGVTTIYVGGDSDAVISSQGTVIRTGGPVDQRVVRPTADVMAVMGSDSIGGAAWNRPPFRGNAEFYARRPTTRMGVAWVFRKALYDAQRWNEKIPTHGADTPPEAAMPYLMAILKGEIPLRIQARMQHDIEAALRLTEEFKLKFTLEEATDAYRCLEALRARNVPVVYGPIYEEATGPRAWRGESQNARLHTFKALLDAGLTTALTAQELRDEDGLARQAMYAIRFGADPQRVLQAVTLTPAKLLRADKEIGSVETGKRADLVAWSGEPFAATTKPVLVLQGGRIESDRRVK
ncbi:MAG: amidohydrolase family protein [Phycisphaerales bacterium]|nr:amidohydrolase family protein [Phycisphaerales bacterium]